MQVSKINAITFVFVIDNYFCSSIPASRFGIASIPKMEFRLKRITWAVLTALVFVDVTNCLMRCFSMKTPNEEQRITRIQSFKRGRFKSPEKPAYSLAAVAIGREVMCNDAYHMLVYLHLTNPQHRGYPDEVDGLNKEIEASYPDWAKKILATAFNVAENQTDTEVPWLLYLYVNWIGVHVTDDQDRVFLRAVKTAHYGMYKVLLCTMFENVCTMYDRATKKQSIFTAYVSAMKRQSTPWSELLEKNWPDLIHNSGLGCCHRDDFWRAPVSGVRPLTEKHLTLDLLYLKDVFHNTEMATTLFADFGVFKDGDQLVKYLEDKMKQIKSGCTSFQRYVESLVDFHEHVIRGLNVMMLRIYYDFFEKLKTVDRDDREKHVRQFFWPYDKWCVFLHLPKFNPLYHKLVTSSYDYDKSFSEATIERLQKVVVDTLRASDNVSKVLLYNHTAVSLQRIDIDEEQLMITAHEYEIPLDLRFRASLENPTRTTILCAEILIGFMKKIFDGVHFKAIHSLLKLRTSKNFERFVEYAQQYHEDVFSLEDETQSIQVCGTQTIMLSGTNTVPPQCTP